MNQVNMQLICPVMKDTPVNKEAAEMRGLVLEYKRKKYHFCCGHCPAEFDNSPEAYAKGVKV